MENNIKNQLEESRKDGTLKETLQGMGFNRLQSVEIAKGLNNEVDITKYADKKYDAAQMKSIRLALEEGMDITPFADNRYNYMQMEEIKAVIREHMDLDAVCNPAYDYSVMKEIRLSERMNYDITKYANGDFQEMFLDKSARQGKKRLIYRSLSMKDLMNISCGKSVLVLNTV